ncbi:HNH endonuclease signature motif containing protein, partial [Nocardiopsis xinjiangensis]|uniref:HNH endonuclease signature motif containing protein n=1 Tax=Nocardiopsis xinjiangensis TaxID=124285 RepID=UPI001F4C7853
QPGPAGEERRGRLRRAGARLRRTFEGTFHFEADHITEFSHGGTTSAANLQPLCSVHNRLKYRRNTRHRNKTGKKPGTGAGAKAPPDSTG